MYFKTKAKCFLSVTFSFLVVVTQGDDSRQFCSLHSAHIISEDTSKQCFMKDVLATLPHSPNQLAVDRNSNTLYFSFDSGQGDYMPAILRIESKNLSVLKGVKDAFAMAYDPLVGEVYFGGSHGIYKYNALQNRCHRLNRDDLDVWWLTVKYEKIYFIKFPSLQVYCYSNKTIRPVSALNYVSVQQFVFDRDDNIFFINGSGLYGVRQQDNQHILLRDSPKFVSLAVDNIGNVYVCSEDGIFVISKMIQKVKRLVNIQGVLGLAFDMNNNIIYSDSHEIVRLLPVTQENYLVSNLL